MHEAKAEWDTPAGRQRRSVVGPDAALELCAEIERRGVDHLLVSFTTEDLALFAIGLGAPDSCAAYWASADPPYFQGRGTADNSTPVTYWHGGQQSEMPGSVRISRQSAFDALAEFMRTGRRPDIINWDVT